MPKLKTHKTAAKRIRKVTRTGKILRLKISSQHLARKKSKRTKAQAKKSKMVSKSDIKKIKKMVPYR